MAWFRREQGALGGEWQRCDGCAEILPRAELVESQAVCPRCGHHHDLPARQRLELLVDAGSFKPLAGAAAAPDPLSFKDTRRYSERLKTARKDSGLDEALLAGSAYLDGRPVVVTVLAGEFLDGSVGVVAGELWARACERALELRCPLVLWASGAGGLRLQEGGRALAALARVVAARAELATAGLPLLVVLSTVGDDVEGSAFALDADVQLAEPSAGVLLERGLVDAVVPRRELRAQLSLLVRTLCCPRTS